MKSAASLRGLLWYPATLVFWLAVSCAALVSTDKETAIVGIIILAVISALAMLLESSLVVALICGAALLIFGYYLQYLSGIQNLNLSTFLTFAAAAIGIAIIASLTRSQIAISSRQVERDRLLIDDLRINEPKTGLMRFHYARRTLSTEVSRSLRFGKNLSLLVMRINQWDELAEEIGMEARENLLVEISEILFNAFRNIDTLYLNIDKIGVILPETTETGAESVAKRVIDQVYRKTKNRISVGLANYPDDSIADEDLFRKAELALAQGILSGKEIFAYSKIREEQVDFQSQTLSDQDEKELQEFADNFSLSQRPIPHTTSGVFLTFSGIGNLNEIDPIQEGLAKISQFENARLIDFRDNELVFSVKTEEKNIQSLLTDGLGIEDDSIHKIEDGFRIEWEKHK